MSACKIPLISAQDVISLSEIVEDMVGSAAVEKAFRSISLPENLRHDQHLFLPNPVLISYVESCARQTGLQYFGLTIGESFTFSVLGVYGKYVLAAANLGLALHRAARALKYYESGSAITITEKHHILEMSYYPANPFVLGAKHQSDVVACMLIELVRHFAGPHWTPDNIKINYSDRSRLSTLEDFFQVPIHLGAATVTLSFPKRLTSLQNAGKHSLEEDLTVHDVRRMLSNRPPRDFTGAVLGTIDLNMLNGCTDIEHTAKWLNLGTRALQRRLQQEGWSYRDLLKAKRHERATELLIETDATITEIANVLGYTSRQHFIRAYKRWTDITPGQARKRGSETFR